MIETIYFIVGFTIPFIFESIKNKISDVTGDILYKKAKSQIGSYLSNHPNLDFNSLSKDEINEIVFEIIRKIIEELIPSIHPDEIEVIINTLKRKMADDEQLRDLNLLSFKLLMNLSQLNSFYFLKSQDERKEILLQTSDIFEVINTVPDELRELNETLNTQYHENSTLLKEMKETLERSFLIPRVNANQSTNILNDKLISLDNSIKERYFSSEAPYSFSDFFHNMLDLKVIIPFIINPDFYAISPEIYGGLNLDPTLIISFISALNTFFSVEIQSVQNITETDIKQFHNSFIIINPKINNVQLGILLLFNNPDDINKVNLKKIASYFLQKLLELIEEDNIRVDSISNDTITENGLIIPRIHSSSWKSKIHTLICGYFATALLLTFNYDNHTSYEGIELIDEKLKDPEFFFDFLSDINTAYGFSINTLIDNISNRNGIIKHYDNNLSETIKFSESDALNISDFLLLEKICKMNSYWQNSFFLPPFKKKKVIAHI